MGLAQAYQSACDADAEMGALLQTLYVLARQSPRITTLGVCEGGVLVALLYARPDALTCFGVSTSEERRLMPLRGSTEVRLDSCIPDEVGACDLLVIDIRDPSNESLWELARHALARVNAVASLGTFPSEGADGMAGRAEGVRHPKGFRLVRSLAVRAGLNILVRD